jgi:hypothetical protein
VTKHPFVIPTRLGKAPPKRPPIRWPQPFAKLKKEVRTG